MFTFHYQGFTKLDKLDNTAYSYWQDETGNKAIADTVLRAILEDPNGKIIQSYIGNEDDKSYMIPHFDILFSPSFVFITNLLLQTKIRILLGI